MTFPVLVPIEFIVVCSKSGYPLIMLKFVILNTKLKMNINSK